MTLIHRILAMKKVEKHLIFTKRAQKDYFFTKFYNKLIFPFNQNLGPFENGSFTVLTKSNQAIFDCT